MREVPNNKLVFIRAVGSNIATAKERREQKQKGMIPFVLGNGEFQLTAIADIRPSRSMVDERRSSIIAGRGPSMSLETEAHGFVPE